MEEASSPWKLRVMVTSDEQNSTATAAAPASVYGDAANPYGRAFAIGSVAGMRSMLAPAAVHLEARDRATVGFALAALGELIADKLPMTPSRLAPPVLTARVLSGAYCGRALALRFGGNGTTGAIAGALGALAGSFVGYGTRKAIASGTKAPDVAVALLEDGVAIVTAVSAQRRPPDLTL